MDMATYDERTIRDGDHVWWTGSSTHDGYAKFSMIYVHRWLVEQDTDLPADWEVDHTCGARHERYGLCVARQHLEPTTKQENMRRAAERRSACRNGHPYTPTNTYTYPSGKRSCRTCRRDGTRRFFEKNPGYQADWYNRRKAR